MKLMTRNEPDSASPPPRQRIAKAMARAGLCSRRDAEAWIVAGRVSVNGTLLTSPALDVSAEDTILVDDVAMPQAEKTRLFLFHKPRGLVISDRDPEGRETVADYLHEHWPDGPRVVTIGRLDINTEGLLLLTNDGGLARLLELPQTGWVRRYRVRAKGTANPADLDALAAGVTIDGIDYAGIEAKLDRTQGANCWLTMGLREGKNREIKRVLEHLGLEVNRLIRLSFGPFQLLDLPEGAVEEVRTRVLRDQLGENLAKQAGVDLGESVVAVEPERKATRPLRAQGPERAPRSRSEAPRNTDARRTVARRPPTDDPPPERQRPTAGTRKHVSTMRAAERTASREGPRKRVERSDTRDRRDRTIAVERLVAPSGGSMDDPSAQRRRPMSSKPSEGTRDSFLQRGTRAPGRPQERQGDAKRPYAGRKPAGPPRQSADARATARPEGRRDGPNKHAARSSGRNQRDRTFGEKSRSPRGAGQDERRGRPTSSKSRGDARERPGQREARPRGRSQESQQGGHRQGSDDRRAGRSDERRASPDRSHESPSARGKRERVARSGQAPRDAASPARDHNGRPEREARRTSRDTAPKRDGGRSSKPRSSNGPRDRKSKGDAGRPKARTGPPPRRGPMPGGGRPDKPRGPRKP